MISWYDQPFLHKRFRFDLYSTDYIKSSNKRLSHFRIRFLWIANKNTGRMIDPLVRWSYVTLASLMFNVKRNVKNLSKMVITLKEKERKWEIKPNVVYIFYICKTVQVKKKPYAHAFIKDNLGKRRNSISKANSQHCSFLRHFFFVSSN